MVEVLHAFAVAPAALGTCCVAADRGRARTADLAASVVMTIAMLDAAVTGLVPAVLWTAVLLLTALSHAVTTRARGAGRRAAGAMSVHAGVGLVVMAALLLLMTASPATAMPGGHHGHGSATGFILVLVIGYAAASAWSARRGTSLERLQYVTMGASTALMGLAALL